MAKAQPAAEAVARLEQVALHYQRACALDGISLELPAGCMVGLIGPDGVGKSSLLALLAGARALQQGRIEVLGGDMARPAHRRRVCPRIAYMPQGLGRNLYPTLSVEENLQFFARLFGHDSGERRRRIDALTRIGRREQAREIFELMLASRNPLGLLSEDTHAETGEMWGNFPQTYSMVGLINAAVRLSTSWDTVI